jgi:hypothetical protein
MFNFPPQPVPFGSKDFDTTFRVSHHQPRTVRRPIYRCGMSLFRLQCQDGSVFVFSHWLSKEKEGTREKKKKNLVIRHWLIVIESSIHFFVFKSFRRSRFKLHEVHSET